MLVQLSEQAATARMYRIAICVAVELYADSTQACWCQHTLF